MPSWVKFFCFLVALPALAAIGFDIYMAYKEIEAGSSASFQPDAPSPFKLTQVGWFWQTYSPDSFEWAKSAITPETWKSYIAPVLRSYAAVLTTGIAVFFYVLLFILSKLGLWPFGDNPGLFAGRAHKDKGDSFSFDADLSNKKKGPAKYNRK